MQKPMFVFIVLVLLATQAEAFSYTSCLAASQAAPYNMSEKEAVSVCGAQNRYAGKGKVGNVLYSLSPPESTLSAEDFARNFDNYVNKGNLRTALCYNSCTRRKVTMQVRNCYGYSVQCQRWVTREIWTDVPSCPSGYELLPNTLGNMTTANTNRLHNRGGSLRSGLCRKS